MKQAEIYDDVTKSLTKLTVTEGNMHQHIVYPRLKLCSCWLGGF